MAKKLEINKWDHYWKLIIISEIESHKQPNWKKVRYFQCECECWNTKNISIVHLKRWHTRSCWCIQTTHWMTWSRIYRIWNQIKMRCWNPNVKRYNDYGGRWITYDPRWEKFENFYEDMKEWYSDNLTIDRKENDWNYCKDNCRWATYKEQNNNKRNTLMK